jgi:hypothetical protein
VYSSPSSSITLNPSQGSEREGGRERERENIYIFLSIFLNPLQSLSRLRVSKQQNALMSVLTEKKRLRVKRKALSLSRLRVSKQQSALMSVLTDLSQQSVLLLFITSILLLFIQAHSIKMFTDLTLSLIPALGYTHILKSTLYISFIS